MPREKVAITIQVPLIFDSEDPWLNFFHAMCLRHGEDGEHQDLLIPEQLDRRIQQLKEAVLTDYGLHLKV